jgi:glc operon protein GlcG
MFASCVAPLALVCPYYLPQKAHSRDWLCYEKPAGNLEDRIHFFTCNFLHAIAQSIQKGETVRNKMCLTASDAEKILAACKAEAEKNKWNVSIAVVDDAGFLVRLERLDGAVAQSTIIATAKAQTAAATRTPTKALEDIVKERPATVAFPGRVAVQGGLPIMYQGECVGGVGVSGAKSHEDEQVASAGLKVLA